MKIQINIKDDTSPTLALECVKKVIKEGRISNLGKNYCLGTSFTTNEGIVWVDTVPNRKSDCFLIYKDPPV